MIAAGLALSEKHGLLFYAASTIGPAPRNIVVVATIADPVRPVCFFDLGTPFGTPQADPITGLGFDDCADELFAVAGQSGILRARISLPGCTVVASSICSPALAYRFHGLCLQPPPVFTRGRSCMSPPCRPCTPRLWMNDAALGNHSFSMSVVFAPNNGFAVPVLNIGPCGDGVDVLCSRFHPALSPAPVFLPAMPLTGPSACTGAATLFIPIAANGGLCGLQFCVQMLVSCPEGGLGLTDAATVRIYGA
jgi:hypothetical protein